MWKAHVVCQVCPQSCPQPETQAFDRTACKLHMSKNVMMYESDKPLRPNHVDINDDIPAAVEDGDSMNLPTATLLFVTGLMLIMGFILFILTVGANHG